MFAVAIWDARRRRLVLARDRYGIKPLYYRHVGGELEFASELRALPRGEIDLDALEAFLAFNSIPAPYSIFRDIRKLPAGHVLVWEDGAVTLERYARPGPRCRGRAARRTTRRSSSRSCARGCATRCVRICSSDVPGRRPALRRRRLGGARRARRAGDAGGGAHVHDRLRGAELRRARRRAAGRRALRHGAPRAARPARAQLLLRALAEAFDEPFADSSALPTYLVSQLAAEHVKVALSGEGGDELFGGYYTYAADLIADRLAPLARLARPLVERAAGVDARRRASTTRRSGSCAPRTCRRSSGTTAGRRSSRAEARAELTGRRRHVRSGGRLSRALRRDGRGAAARAAAGRRLRRLSRRRPAREDRPRLDGALARGARPFLDPLVTNLAFALPTRHKVRGLAKKVLLRKAVEPLVPREVVHGRKRGFSIPAAAWLRGELEPFARETLVAGEPAAPGLLPAGAGDAAARRARRRPRGLEPPAVGAARVHALVRAARRAGAAAARSARMEALVGVKVWIDMTARRTCSSSGR